MKDPKVLTNDALVVMVLDRSMMTHSQFRLTARRTLELHLTESQACNMLSRAKGRTIRLDNGTWRLTVAGLAYRDYVRDVMQRTLALTATVTA